MNQKLGKKKKQAMTSSQNIPLIQLPLFATTNTSPYWYGLLPEIINIQGSWIDTEWKKLTLDKELSQYLQYAISLHHTALIVAGNNRALFSLFSLRGILERIALSWTAHSLSPRTPTDFLKNLKSTDTSTRKQATQNFMDFAEKSDLDFRTLYDMVSQYFAHASIMDSIALGNTSAKDKLLQQRAKMLPLLLLLDVGQRLVVLINTLAADQGKHLVDLSGGRIGIFKYDLGRYVRVCAYIMCEMHSKKKGVPISTLMKNMGDVPGEIGLTDIYRGGMEVVRIGDPKVRPDPAIIANFAWWGIGKGHDDKVKVKCEEEMENGERYVLSWPKTLELDSSGVAMVAGSSKGDFPFFDYISKFINVIQSNA